MQYLKTGNKSHAHEQKNGHVVEYSIAVNMNELLLHALHTSLTAVRLGKRRKT